MEQNRLEEIKKEIYAINPKITDRLLDLLYEYISCKFSLGYSYSKYMEQVKTDTCFEEFIKNMNIN